MDRNSVKFTPKCRTEQLESGYRFTFSCELCDHSYTTPVFPGPTRGEALRMAEQDARLRFNRCACCRRWVCDEHYNENRMMCTVCAPRICQACGAALLRDAQFCTVCGASQYEKADEKEESV